MCIFALPDTTTLVIQHGEYFALVDFGTRNSEGLASQSDSHARNQHGMMDANGKSVLLHFNSLDDVFAHLTMFSGELNLCPRRFEISGVEIVHIDSSSSTCKDVAAVPSSSAPFEQSNVDMQDDSYGEHPFDLQTSNRDDSDDDVVVTHVQNKELYFNPLSEDIARSLCGKLNVEFERANYKSCMVGELGLPCATENIVGDGNCFFRALSQAISGNQKSHRKIRLAVVNQLQRNSHLYDSILRSEYSSISQYIAISRMNYVGAWATELEIQAAADYFGVNIFTFFNDKWLEYSSQSSFSNHGMYLQNISGNHYETVVCVKLPNSQTCYNYCMNTVFSGGHKTRPSTTEPKTAQIMTVKTESSIEDESVGILQDNENTLLFTPLSELNAKTLCNNLKIDFEEHSFQKVILRGPLGNVCKIKNIVNDGNSFFRAVAYALSGSEKNHRKIRLAVVSHMTNNREECEKLLTKDFASVTKYVNQSQIKYVGHCATEIEFKSAANMLGLDIYVFNSTQWTKYNSNSRHLTNEAIYLQNCDNHFDAVICAKQGDKDSCFEFCEDNLSLKTQPIRTRSSQGQENAKQTVLSGKANPRFSKYLSQKKNRIQVIKYRTQMIHWEKMKSNQRNLYKKNLLYKEHKKKSMRNKYHEDKTYQVKSDGTPVALRECFIKLNPVRFSPAILVAMETVSPSALPDVRTGTETKPVEHKKKPALPKRSRLAREASVPARVIPARGVECVPPEDTVEPVLHSAEVSDHAGVGCVCALEFSAGQRKI
ncbi:uncharacterized protein LOC106943455 [Poecilia latipinna]|uniref:uncharacterized protein LOC106943455 n=1 Tax=Poecilia latipinna TaxID=48699 RepID=UPI00072DAE44|nr:PREDICTED: uncharacterized protein LOC106943455 [Poecilia latipinna]